MEITRKKFLQMTAGATALAAVSSSSALSASCAEVATSKIKRGVSVWSYTDVLGISMTLEDVMEDIYDLEPYGVEILGNSHVEGYPNPTEEWCEHFKEMCAMYNITPVEYGHWVDSRLHRGRDLNSDESYEMLVRDIKIASKLGFTVLRTKIGVIDDMLDPVPNWLEFIERALPVAEEYNTRMCTELHSPILLQSKMVEDHIEFIEKTKTKYFGFNLDFSCFKTKPGGGRYEEEGQMKQALAGTRPEGQSRPTEYNVPEEMVHILPYTYACHAKFHNMTDDYQESYIPYEEIIAELQKNNWEGCLLSEYDGPRLNRGVVTSQLRKQHIMMRRLLGEV